MKQHNANEKYVPVGCKLVLFLFFQIFGTAVSCFFLFVCLNALFYIVTPIGNLRADYMGEIGSFLDGTKNQAVRLLGLVK